MKEIFQRWLTRRPHCAGVLGWGLHFDDQAVFSLSFAPQAKAASLDGLWVELAQALLRMPQHATDTHQMRWVFSQSILYAAHRPDGVTMGVLVEQSSDKSSRVPVERALSDFRAVRVPVSGR